MTGSSDGIKYLASWIKTLIEFEQSVCRYFPSTLEPTQ